jgi:hypothetical protein
MKRLAVAALGTALLVLGCAQSASKTDPDPLPSWNEGPAKQAISNFVSRVTTKGSHDFVTPRRTELD